MLAFLKHYCIRNLEATIQKILFTIPDLKFSDAVETAEGIEAANNMFQQCQVA